MRSQTSVKKLEPQMSRLRPPNRQKKTPGNKHEQKHLVYPRYQKYSARSSRNQTKSKPGAKSVLYCSPGCPRIVPGSPKMPMWRHQACQVTGLGANKMIEKKSNAQCKQPAPNKPTSHQADQNITKPASQQPGRPQLSKGPAAGTKHCDEIKHMFGIIEF